MGQQSSPDNQYQCGQPLLPLGIVAAIPITSPRIKNQSTCRSARPGAKGAPSQAKKMEITTTAQCLRGELIGWDTTPKKFTREYTGEQRVGDQDKRNRHR